MRRRLQSGWGAALLLAPVAAMAEVPAEVMEAIEVSGVDAAIIGTAILVVLTTMWALKVLRRAK